ncbi:MAG TPA: fumarylacetoacetate hydrolase family protein [Gammaproteobacteria bacterium]
MDTSPIKIQRGMTRQIQTWRDLVASRDHRLGWKVGFNMVADQQRLKLPSAMVGYLTKERSLISGSQYKSSPNSVLLVEPEIAILIGNDVPANATAEQANAAIKAYTAALELVDTTRSVDNDIEEILGCNMFHESVLLAEQRLAPNAYIRDQLTISLSINNNEIRTLEQQRVPQNFSIIICDVANILTAHGEQLKKGDWIITGAAAKPAPVHSGDKIALDMGTLGKISLNIE